MIDVCPTCEGDRVIPVQAAPVFSTSAEQWYPVEEEEVCPDCRGTGEA